MRAILTVLAVAGLATGTPAFAQSSASTSGTTAPSSGSSQSSSTSQSSANGRSQTPGAMQQSVKHDLEQAGFSDVQVMPSSFLVRAKDKQGRPVMMVINPDSVTEITNVGHSASAATPKK